MPSSVSSDQQERRRGDWRRGWCRARSSSAPGRRRRGDCGCEAGSRLADVDMAAGRFSRADHLAAYLGRVPTLRERLASAPPSVHHPAPQKRGNRMDGAVILEEHFATARRSADSQVFGATCGRAGPRLTDFQDKRLRLMDESGVEIMILR